MCRGGNLKDSLPVYKPPLPLPGKTLSLPISLLLRPLLFCWQEAEPELE